MICVSVGRGRHKMMMAEHKHLAENGAELVELRLDYIRRPVDLKRLLKDAPCPGSEEERIMVLRTAIADGADYVDLEMDIAGKIPRYKTTQRIVSYHNFEETPANLEAIHREMTKLDPDIIKIATMANNPMDNIATLGLCRNSTVPTIAFCMGEMGVTSRIMCGKFGAPFTYATFSSERKLAPGQLSFEEMRDKYLYDSISEETRILGVIADPVAHSLSPVVHNACIRKNELDYLYLPFRVPREYLEQFIGACEELNIVGLSVTIPHKENVLKCINALDDNVAGIKAANTLVFKQQNVFGYNTDCTAAVESIKRTLRDKFPEEEDPLVGKQALILGSGGVRGNFDCDVMINCTPVGMYPDMDVTPFEPEWFDPNCVVFDTIYNPEQTLFIKQAREAGCTTITGIDMFVRQAARQFKLFTGTNPDVKLIRYEVKRAISAAKY